MTTGFDQLNQDRKGSTPMVYSYPTIAQRQTATDASDGNSPKLLIEYIAHDFVTMIYKADDPPSKLAWNRRDYNSHLLSLKQSLDAITSIDPLHSQSNGLAPKAAHLMDCLECAARTRLLINSRYIALQHRPPLQLPYSFDPTIVVCGDERALIASAYFCLAAAFDAKTSYITIDTNSEAEVLVKFACPIHIEEDRLRDIHRATAPLLLASLESTLKLCSGTFTSNGSETVLKLERVTTMTQKMPN